MTNFITLDFNHYGKDITLLFLVIFFLPLHICMFRLSLSIFFHSLAFRWEVPTPRSIRLSLFIQHVWVRAKLIADISPLTPLTFLLMPLRCVLFVPPSSPNQISLFNPPTLFSYPGKKKLFPFIVCMCVSEKDRVPGWKIQWTCEKLLYLSSFSPCRFLYFFLFLKTSPETVCALSTLSPFLYLYFLFFNLSSGSLLLIIQHPSPFLLLCTPWS